MAEILFEIIGDLFLEGALEIAADKKISKWVRYPIALLIILFFTVVIGGLIVLGLMIFDENAEAGFLFVALGTVLMVLAIVQFRKAYIREVDEQ